MEKHLTEETLDPADWSEVTALSHRIVEDSVGYLRDIRERPAWREMPDDVRSKFESSLPTTATPIGEVYQEVVDNIMAYPMGNVHPTFWGWYMGSSNFTGALGDYLAAIQGSNLAGGNHAATLVDGQVVNWCKEMLGFPADASGTLVSGGSAANLIGLTVARNAMAGIDLRENGVAALPRPLRFYGSDQLHSCHQKAVEALGLGNKSLRRIATDDSMRIDISKLEAAIRQDRALGYQPACIIANAGTVNTGAIDDLHALADLADREGLWFHVDGCIGALMAIAPENRHLVSGIERAHSVALDPHKLLHAPFEAGCALVRDARVHRGTFAVTPEFLEPTTRGLAAAENWLHDFGLQTTRGFRALKIWMALKEHGVAKFGRLIDQTIRQAAMLTELIDGERMLELMAPTTINIVCFRFRSPFFGEVLMKETNLEIMLRLQERGIAVVSDTTVKGKHCLRVAIANHRTRREDLENLVQQVVSIGSELLLSDPRTYEAFSS
jgi:glutamate/tyrosine decarboxylase-like PLP-dependent enzyme